MPKKIQKSLQDYISKMKKPRQHIPLPSHSRKWILSRCKHPKTLSFALNQTRKPAPSDNNDDDSATLSDVDRFLYENFKSLYLEDQESRTNAQNDRELDRKPGTEPVFSESPRFVNPPPGSLTEESRSSVTTTTTTNDSILSNDGKAVQLPDQCIAVLAQSVSPVEDFRRSMEEVVEAKLRQEDNEIEWEYMEELLFCYLNMNDKKSYKYILSAFVDQVVVLRDRSGQGTPARN